MIATASFTEHDFDVAFEWATEAEADAFAMGFMDGSRAYGAGSCTVYVLPRDAEEMAKLERTEERQKVEAALEKLRREQAS